MIQFPFPIAVLYVLFIGLGIVLITLYKLQERGKIRVNDWAIKIVFGAFIGWFVFQYILPSIYMF